MCLASRWLMIGWVLIVTGCSSTSGFFGLSTTQQLDAVEHPSEKVFLLYQHGSQPENIRDPCHPNSTFLPGRVPEVIARLAGTKIAGHEVFVYALCSQVQARFGDYPESELKVRLRAAEIRDLLKRIQALDVPPQQVFLVGHSAGAWASLLVATESPEMINAVVGFAPAFAGQKALRSELWQSFFEQQRNELLSANKLDALLYTFKNDHYYDLQDLQPMESINHVIMIWPDNDKCLRGHRAVFRTCFGEVASDTIRNYLRQRLEAER